jgi:cell division transport system ATP-binding protein
VIRLDAVVKEFPGGQTALAGLSLHIPVGQRAVLTGPSGTGKSTALHIMGLFLRPTRGRVVVGGSDLATIDPRGIPAFRQRVAMIFQDQRLLLDRTVEDNVALPLIVAGHRRIVWRPAVHSMLEQLGLAEESQRIVRSLSVGEQQRIGIARALIIRPDVLLADEPTAHLDPRTAQGVVHLLTSAALDGITVVVASHDAHWSTLSSVRQIRLESGRITGDSHA